MLLGKAAAGVSSFVCHRWNQETRRERDNDLTSAGAPNDDMVIAHLSALLLYHSLIFACEAYQNCTNVAQLTESDFDGMGMITGVNASDLALLEACDEIISSSRGADPRNFNGVRA